MPEQTVADYKSKYLDLHDKVVERKKHNDSPSLLEDVDFELTLIHRDEINVAYILKSLRELEDNPKEYAEQNFCFISRGNAI